MRLMPRDRELLTRLAGARWLTTRQIAALCFPGVNLEMARRRLRLLRDDGYVFTSQTNQMAEALHSLDVKGKGLVLGSGWKRRLRLERVPPKNLEHFVGINDIRAAVARAARKEEMEVSFFYA